MRGCVVVGVAALVLAGCSAIQEDLECPGDYCSRELSDIADNAGHVAGVQQVVRAWRFSNVDKGSAAGIEVIADVSSEPDASTLATQLAGVVAAGDLEPTESIRIVVVPASSRAAAPESTVVTMPAALAGADVPCAASQCAAELELLAGALAAELEGTGAEAAQPSWSAAGPTTAVVVDATEGARAQTEVNDLVARISRAASRAGATQWGEFRATLSFRRREDFEFSFGWPR